MNNFIKNPVWILAGGAAVGLAIWGLLAGLAQLVPAVGLAIGLVISLATTGTAAGVTLAPAMGAVVAGGAAATGVAVSLLITVRIMREATSQPLKWGTPILSLLSGFLVHM